MSLKPEQPRKKNRFINFIKRLFRKIFPSPDPQRHDSKGDHPNSLSAVSQSPAQRERLQGDPADLGSRTNLDRPQSPINMPVDSDVQTGNSTGVETALTVVKESIKVIARVGGAFAPLKAVAEGLGVIFDRIDVGLLSSVPILSM